MPGLGTGIRLRCSAYPGAPVISGTAFPGETLTSTQPVQWLANGSPISGETGSTYLVRLSDIGKAITQTGSNTITIWHPDDISGVARFWSSLTTVLNSISPDVSATDGQAVRRWNGIITGTQADQTTGTFQPLYRSTGQSGNPSLQFDGSNDGLILPASSNVLQNKSQAYLILGVRPTNPTGGNVFQVAFGYSTGPGTARRLSITTRGGTGLGVYGRRLDADSEVSALSTTSDANYHVVTGHGDYSNGLLKCRIDGAAISSTAFSSGSGSTSNTASASAAIGHDYVVGNHSPCHITAACVVNASISATELSQLERYIGLFGNLNIPLV